MSNSYAIKRYGAPYFSLLFVIVLALALAPITASAAPKNGIEIRYQDAIVFEQFGSDNREIHHLLWPINNELRSVAAGVQSNLRPQLENALPSYLELESLLVLIDRNFFGAFQSLGNGQLTAIINGPAVRANATISVFGQPWLGNADIRAVLSTNLAATYDVYTGAVGVAPGGVPSISIDYDLGGLAALLDFLTFGLLDSILQDVVDRMVADFEVSIADILSMKIDEFSAEMFGLNQFIPENLHFGNVNVTQFIRNELSNTPAGNIISVQYFSLNAAKRDLWIRLGNNAEIYLYSRVQPSDPNPCGRFRC